MNALCACVAHSSSAQWAGYAHDFSLRLGQTPAVDVAWFKARKKALGITDQHVADAVRRERSVITKVLTDKAAFQLEYLEPMAARFEVSKEELLFRAGVLDQPPAEPHEAPPEEVLSKMLEDVLFGIPPGTPLSAYPDLAAAELRGQLALYLAGQIDQSSVELSAENIASQCGPQPQPSDSDSARS